MGEQAKVITCGCRFNRYESEEIRARLGNGTEKPVVVINTCAVTTRSEAKSRYAIRRAVSEHPDASIVVAGCLAELTPESVRSMEGVDLVLGNEEKFFAADLLERDRTIPVTGGVNRARSFLETDAGTMENRTAAYLKIQNGCDERCSFCVVRMVRGKSRSASPHFVARRVEELVAQGVREIVLTGINIGQYGEDLEEGLSLTGLLRLVTDRNGVRFRISSINPLNIGEDLISLIAGSPSICRHLHIPLQSGSANILKAMERPYTAEQYRNTVETVAERIPGIAIGCDVMAGFPGETEEDFESTRRMMEELPLSYAHVFPYSHRPGTVAAEMKVPVPAPVIRERVAILKELAGRKNLAFRRSLVGSNAQVHFEAESGIRGMLRGKTDTFVPVECEWLPQMKGTLQNCLIEGLAGDGLRGRIAWEQ